MLENTLRWRQDCDNLQSSKLCTLYEGSRGIEQLHQNNAVLRIWLPVAAKTALEQCRAQLGKTAANYLREFFVVYLYGEHELLRMKADKTGLYYIPPPNPSRGGSFYQRVSMADCIPGLGKNIVPLKLKLPAKLKSDLETLAQLADVPLGRFIREILVSRLLGHTLLPERLETAYSSAEEVALADRWADAADPTQESGSDEGNPVWEVI